MGNLGRRRGKLDSAAMIVLTSRPTAMDDNLRSHLADLGFEGRRIADLTPVLIRDLSTKMLNRLGVGPQKAAAAQKRKRGGGEA